MDPKSYVTEDTSVGDEDLLSREAVTGNLVRFFMVGGHPNLTPERRVELYLQIAERLPARELKVLETIRSHRGLPGNLARITRNIVRQAFRGLLEMPVVPAAPAQEYSQIPSNLHVPPGETAPDMIHDRAERIVQERRALVARELSAAERKYQEWVIQPLICGVDPLPKYRDTQEHLAWPKSLQTQ